jgi:probable selenium-dependent hydroxylase accessory protein YqeC
MALTRALIEAIGLPSHAAVAFAGAGGKTTAMFDMARGAAPAIVTTTTHLAETQAALAETHVVWLPGEPLPESDIPPRGVVLLTGGVAPREGRLRGLEPEQWAVLQSWCARHARPLLVEADGSRQRPLKAPADHEPAIPHPVDAVIVVAGMLGCGLPLDDEHVHRPARFAALAGCSAGDAATPAAMAAVLTHADGGLKNIPAGAKRAVLLNQADSPELRARAAAMAPRLRLAYHVVAVASFRAGFVEIL